MREQGCRPFGKGACLVLLYQTLVSWFCFLIKIQQTTIFIKFNLTDLLFSMLDMLI